MLVLAIDPGPVQSGFVLLDYPFRLALFGKYFNEDLRTLMQCYVSEPKPVIVAIEEIASYGMAVGKEVFDTARWSGRYQELALSEFIEADVQLVPRREVKLQLCGTVRAKDSNIRQAVIDKFGGSGSIGTKKNPGPLYGVTKDVWAALALAITVAEIKLSGE